MPFVALQFYSNEEMKSTVTMTTLVGSFSIWLLLNIIFFRTIDRSYMNTFFGTMTAPQYTCMLYNTAGDDDDETKFDAVFSNRIQFTTSIHGDVKERVASNIERWQAEKPAWFRIELVPDEFLPNAVYEAAGGANRRRSSRVSFMSSSREVSPPNKVHPGI